MRNCAKIFFLAVCCVMVFNLPAFAKGDTLTVAYQSGFKSLDPHVMGSASHSVTFNIHESLVGQDSWKAGNAVPLLAERWEAQPDGVSFKFFLKKGVKFHNGEVMTADDVVFSFKRAMATGGIKVFASILSDVVKVDDYTVILKAAQPAGEPFLLSLSHPWGAILNKKATEAAGKDYGQNPVGTGRFKFVQWVMGDAIRLERFDDYYGEKARVKHLICRPIGEAASRTIELESGAVDMIIDAPPGDMGRIEDNPDLRTVTVPSTRLFYLGFDITKAPYDNAKVRQALNLAMDREGMAKVVYRGYAKPARGPVISAAPYNKYDVSPTIKRDIAKAKQLLKEAGYPDGFKGQIVIGDRSDHVGLSTILQANFKEIGVDMEIKTYEWGTFLDVIRQKGHEPFLQSWWGSPPAVDPYFFVVPFHSKAIGGSNRMWYSNQKVDELIDQGMRMRNGPEREAVYSKLWDILNEDLPWLYMLDIQQLYGHHKSLKGVEYSPTLVNYYGNAYFEE